MKVVAAIIIYKKEILAFQRKYSSDKSISNKYEFPGGKVNDNESDLCALKRELWEELNLKIDRYHIFSSTEYEYPKKKVFLKFYICEINNLNFKLNVHKNYKLLNKNNIYDQDWLEGNYQVIESLMLKKII